MLDMLLIAGLVLAVVIQPAQTLIMFALATAAGLALRLMR